MTDEQTNTSDTPGNQADPVLENDNKATSEYDQALALVKRREAANKAELEILVRKEKLAANQILSGTSGGHVEATAKDETPKEYRDRIDKEISEGKHID